MMPSSGLKTIGDVVGVLETRAPSGTAESWDNTGLLVGDPKRRVTKVAVAIDLSRDALTRAERAKANLLVTHHPCIFPKSKGISRVVSNDRNPKTGLIFEAIERGMAIAACHTNFDRCALEVPRAISRGLGLTPRGRLLDKPVGSLMKLSVYVPVSHIEMVRSAVCEAGAGHIGNYDFCSFSSKGEGTFRGLEGSNPSFGKSGRLERVEEVRLESVLPRGMEKSVLKALVKAHPYEEVAYDLFPIEQAPTGEGLVKGLGYGFWGQFDRAKPFSDVAQDVKRLFKVDGFLMTATAPKKVTRVAFAAGKGSSVVNAASSLGCDLMITGETGYHEAFEAASRNSGMGILELGHRESEAFFVPTIKGWLADAGFKAVGFDIRTQRVFK